MSSWFFDISPSQSFYQKLNHPEYFSELVHNCPKCKSKIEIQRTFNQKIHFSCPKCKIEDIIDSKKNLDEAFLEFLIKFDNDEIPTKKQSESTLEKEGILQTEDEINKMIGKAKIADLTRSILFSKKYYVSHFEIIEEPDPEMGSSVIDSGLDPRIIEALESRGIEKFYKFQEELIHHIVSGDNVVITAPTASGKTEAFVVPIIEKIGNSKNSTSTIQAIFVYPTKALSRDQFPKIKEIADKLDICCAVFDGDTKQVERAEVLANPPQIIITNFDVLHYHLWHRTRFASLFNTTRFLAIDEAHVYSGIFGSNVHYIIKRLKRIASKLQIVAASATLENALPFCQTLFGVKMVQVSGSGKKGKIEFSMLFPSLMTQRALMIDILKKLTLQQHKTLVFSNSHLNSELLALQARKQKLDIKVHRAGLMANYRRSVETLFKNDKFLQSLPLPHLSLE